MQEHAMRGETVSFVGVDCRQRVSSQWSQFAALLMLMLAGCETGGGSGSGGGGGGGGTPTQGTDWHELTYKYDQTFNILKIEMRNPDPNATADWLLVDEAVQVIDNGPVDTSDPYASGINRFRARTQLQWNASPGIEYKVTPGVQTGSTVTYSTNLGGSFTANGSSFELGLELHEVPGQ